MSLQTINTPRDTTFNTTESTPRNIADAIADELSGIASAISNIGSNDYDDLTNKPQVNGTTLSGNKSSDDLSLAAQSDLTSIKATGTTNATGAIISKGTYFYLNGTLCQAKADIATGATFTLNTNYEVVTAGGLNSLNSALDDLKVYQLQATIDYSASAGGNYQITNLPAGTVPIAVAPWQATDCNMTLFYSSTTHKWYIHCSNFQTGAMVTNASFTRVDVYYVKYAT